MTPSTEGPTESSGLRAALEIIANGPLTAGPRKEVMGKKPARRTFELIVCTKCGQPHKPSDGGKWNSCLVGPDEVAPIEVILVAEVTEVEQQPSGDHRVLEAAKALRDHFIGQKFPRNDPLAEKLRQLDRALFLEAQPAGERTTDAS